MVVAQGCRSVLTASTTSSLALIMSVPFGASLLEMGALGTGRAAHSPGDVAKAQLLAILAIVIVLLALILRKISEEMISHEKLTLSHEALLKQVKGLQEEYNRMSNEAKESGALSRAEKETLLGRVSAAEEAKRSAETRVEAMISQAKGMDKEYDRLLDENNKLKRQLPQFQSSHLGYGSKKDM
eukprot:evm.model.scf_434.1 EVM.evm.TU.scf_434.1   scf_434:701-4129(-)